MTGWSPPSPPAALVAGVAVLALAWLVYAVLVQGSFLLGLLPVLVLAALYVLWRFLVALEAVADGLHRIADEDEREG